DRQFSVYFGRALASLGRIIEGPVARLVYRNRPVVAVSPSTAQALKGRLSWRGPVFIVPNGAPRPTKPCPTDPAAGPSLVCVGRLVAHKRVDQIIRVAEELRERWPGLRLHIVGRGEQHGALAEQIRVAGLEQTVTLHGFLPMADKDALLAAADLHISASRYEGWGLSVIEAAAFGVPTVAYDVDGLRDAVRDGDTGWLAIPGENLADTVLRALKELHDPGRRVEMAAACIGWAGEFTWDSSGDRMTRLIQGDLDEY
ncbi:MAG: glycosyltransferase family 4 protein, partial [Streptosporangiaceae bacterium]